MRPMILSLLLGAIVCNASAQAPDAVKALELMDVFDLEFAVDPQISPDGKQIIYVRTFMDVMKDARRGNLWTVSTGEGRHLPLTTGMVNDSSPRYSPDGKRLAYISRRDGKPQIIVRWLSDGRELQVAQLQHGANQLHWSPDGHQLAFAQFVPAEESSLAKMPTAPEGAEWAKPARVIDNALYRSDGSGYRNAGFMHLFVVPSEGGTPRQITSGNFQHQGQISWMPDGTSIVFSANRRDDWELNLTNSEIYRVDAGDGTLVQLTDRTGPDRNPIVSPDGRWIAYTGFDDRYQGYQIERLYLMTVDGDDSRMLTGEFDRGIGDVKWSADGKSLYVDFDEKGDTFIGRVDLEGSVTKLTNQVGGTAFGRPYSGGSFSVSERGDIAFTWTSTQDLAEVAVLPRGKSEARRLTHLNRDVLGHRVLAEVEEIWAESSHDGWQIQGWLAKPPGFDASRKYPLILEIHGGPFANYGARFSTEVQLYAAAGYLVLYANPRGSTSYGETFGNAIHHAYPGFDYDDLMSITDAVIDRGIVDTDQLFVTGGSGGGVLTSWIVGKTGRFAAAVVAKPVINWTSFVLTADFSPIFTRYWFEKMPWEDPDHYWSRSPLSLVGNVTTPTMLLTGESDYRTPISETEQYYQALKLRKVDSMMIRIPDASHGIASRPSNLIAKVAHILAWFERYRGSNADKL